VRIALCQLDIAWENKAANHRRTRALLDSADMPPGSLLLLPEMFSTGFSMEVEVISEGLDRPTIRFMKELAAERAIYVVGGVVTQGSDGRGRNEAVAVSPKGEVIARYAKIHPFVGGEARNYAGGTNIVTFECGGFRASPFVCYDLRFPEVFRLAMLRGAGLLLVIANWPEKRIHHWTALLQARAIENQAYVAGVNRCGTDPSLRYPGRSIVVDPEGRTIAEADSAEQLLCADIEVQSVDTWRRAFPAVRGMRCAITLPENSHLPTESGPD
jgi:predicted amidohydrolase